MSKSVLEPRAVLDAAMTERQLFESVRAHLEVFKFAYYHTFDSRRSAAGFPDIVAVRIAQRPSERDRLLFIELKSEKGRLTAAQEAWLFDLRVCGAETHFWRPSDLSSGLIESVLRGTA